MNHMNEYLDESAVRGLFVYLKENLLFDSLQDELEQKQILTQREKDDYVCKDRCKYIRCERLLKLIIRKQRCNKFFALINDMPCYKHISKKFVEFRENVIDQQTISTGAVLTHSFILTDDMLEKHFALFYMELEPWDIADKMFQAGHISVSEHDDVTDYSQKHKRLRGLLDMLKRRKCLHAPFLSLLQSKQYTHLLETLKNERKLSYKPCEPALWIQHNFTLLQDELPYTDDVTIVLIEHIFKYPDIADVQRCTGTRRKKSKILKILLLKRETACVEFLRVVEEDLKRKDLLQTMKERSDDRIKRGKPDLSPELRRLGIRCLKEHSELLHNELDPLYFCDLLFEEKAISILAHDKITEVKRRQKQIRDLIEVIENENENDCFHFFLYILQRDEYKYIRETLERPASEAENVESSEQLEMKISHHVKMVQGDVPNGAIAIQMRVDGPVGVQVEHDLYQHINSSDTEILEDTISHGQMDILNVSLGSVVLQLRPLTDQAVKTLLNANDNNRLLELILGIVKKANIAQILKSTEPLTLKLQVYSVKSADVKTGCQMSKTAMIIERVKAYRHVLVTQLEPTALASLLSKSKSFSESIKDTVNDADSCYERVERILLLVEKGNNDIVEEFVTALNDLGYSEIVKLINPSDVHNKAENIRNMITFNYKNILEEMQMTLVVETLSKCIGRVDDIKDKCLPKNGNRRQRMNRFLQFILQDDHNVIEFEKVLSNNGLKELLKNPYSPGEHVSEKDMEVTVIEDNTPLSSEEVLFESVITLAYKDQKESEPQDLPKNRACVGSNAKKTRCSPNSKLVAAIDFGTAYSGHAFSSRVDFENDPLQIKVYKWSRNLLAHKTPTSALFDENKTLIAFGYEAEKKFRELSNDNKHHDHYFFERFKMQLYNESGDKKQKKLTKKSMICDISGKELSAMYVFSKAIEYMHDHLLEGLKEQNDDDIAKENIRWVLTVPAIWDYSAKQFMRDAAEQAGIRSECLTVALESEAASVYCKKVKLVKLSEANSDEDGFDIFSPGHQYLILDAGGGTVDITIHEVLTGDRIKELHKATGGAWGGTYLDDEFFKIFEECFGKDEFENFKKDDLAGYIDLREELELKKRDINTSTRKISFTIPAHLRGKCDTSRSEFAKYLVCKKEKLELDGDLIQKWYSVVCEKIKKHVKNLLEEHKIDNILMVGGFSESQFLQETMTKAFPNKYIVVPNEASLAVLKGAVLFGHDPSSIDIRVARYTYGVNTLIPVVDEQSISDKKRIQTINGVRYEIDVFHKHVTKGDILKIGEVQHEKFYSPLYKEQNSIRFRIYSSPREDPMYVDESDCNYLGYITVDIPNIREDLDRRVLVRFIFGGTEIRVEGVNEKTNKVTYCTFTSSDDPEKDKKKI